MRTHVIDATPKACHASFAPARAPIATADPGDVVEFRAVPDVSWGLECPVSTTATRRRMEPNDRSGPCLCGPIAVRGARPGSTLAIEILEIVPGDWGFTYAGSRDIGSAALNERLGVADAPEILLRWTIDGAARVATNQHGHRVPLAPFHGCIGVAHAPECAPAPNPWQPRRTGGNMDCRHLVAGSTLLLPVEAPGALLSVGDTHAAQGDGELSGTAIECMAARSRLRVSLIDRPIGSPVALTPDGLVTLSAAPSIEDAMSGAVGAMLDLLAPALGISRAEALGLMSVTGHARITQVVNGVFGAHALVPRAFVEAHDVGETLLRGR